MHPPKRDPLVRAARLLPAAYALHVAEEAPGFAAWVRRHAAVDYTQREFARINALGFAGTVLAGALVDRGGGLGRAAYYTAILTAQALWNPVFHVGTTLAWREYSPGLATSLALFVPLWTSATRGALHSGALTRRQVRAGIVVGGAMHAATVASTVFHRPRS
jgi:hypothetical protein